LDFDKWLADKVVAHQWSWLFSRTNRF